MAKPTIQGREVSPDEFQRYWAQVFQQDPVMQQLQQQSQAQAFGGSSSRLVNTKRYEKEATDRAKALGFEPPNEDWNVVLSGQGYTPHRAPFGERNLNWIAPAVLGAATLGAGSVLAGPAAGAASTGSTAATGGGAAAVPTAGATVGPGVGFGAGGAPVASAGFASGGGALGGAGAAAGIVGPVISSKDFWGKLALGIGGDLFNGYIANRSANKAADELIKSGDKQIAAYDKALGPYMDPAPLNALKFLSGLPAGGGQVQGSTAGTPVPGQMATTGRTAPPNVPSLGTAVPRGTLASLVPQAQRQQAQQQTASSFVRMVSPDGEEGDVHPSQVQSAIQAGARPLQAAMGRG